MTTTQLHNEIKLIADNKVAFSFSTEFITTLFMYDFEKSYKDALNKTFPINGLTNDDGTFKLGAKLVEVIPNINDLAQDKFRSEIEIDKTISTDPIINILDTFSISLLIHKFDDESIVLSKIKYEISELKSLISISDNKLSLNENLDFKVNSPIDYSANREANLILCKITEKEILTLEGTIAYVFPQKIINSYFLSLAKLNLKKIFVAFNFFGEFDTQIIETTETGHGAKLKKYLILVAQDELTLQDLIGCGIKLNELLPDINRLPDGGYSNTTNPYDLSIKGKSNGFVSTYIPKKIFDLRFSKLTPAISFHDSDNGFIGYEVDFVVSFNSFSLNIISTNTEKCLEIDLGLTVRGNGNASIDAGDCFGRVHLADIGTEVDCNIKIKLDFAISDFSSLLIKAYVSNIDFPKKPVTNVSFISKWAGIFGLTGTAIGIAIDSAFVQILNHNIPIEIRHLIEKQGVSYNIKLIDLSSFQKYFKGPKNANGIDTLKITDVVTFSGESNSVLVGLNNNIEGN